MTRLVINAKLAIPGLVTFAYDVYNDTYSEELVMKYVPDLVKSFSRFTKSGISSFIEEYYCTYDISDSNIKLLRALVLDFVKQLRTDVSVNANLVELFTLASSVIGGNEKAYFSLRDKISIIPQRDVVMLFPLDVDTEIQGEKLEYLATYTQEEIKQLREDKSDKYKDILRAKKAIKQVTTTFIRQYVRERGLLVAYDKLISALTAANIEHSLPAGFVGYIDEFCGLYTLEKKKLAITPYNCVITMNPKYDAKLDNTYVCQAKSSEAKNYTAVYTANFKKEATAKKFKAVKDLTSSINTVRNNWLSCLLPTNKDFESAIVLELIYATQARLGSKQNATLDKATQKYKRTYGISTILNTHITINDRSITIKYPGKAAFKGDIHHYQIHEIGREEIHPQIYSFLLKRAAIQGPVFKVSQQKVRDLLQACGAPEGVTVHKLRTLKGTGMMTERIAKHPFKNTKTSTSAVTKWLKEQALDVGITLGHMSGEKYTSSTAIAHYIDPVTMLKLYKEARVMPTKAMLKLLHIDTTTIESVE